MIKTNIAALILLIAVCGAGFGQSEVDFTFTESDGRITITGYRGATRDVVIPAIINGLPVVAIGTEAFAFNRLTSVSIPNGVTTIGAEAFAFNQLTSASIPGSVTSIGDRAFAYNGLTSVSIPNGVTTIGDGAFAYNRLTNITLPANVDIQLSSFNGIVYERYNANGRRGATFSLSQSTYGYFEIIVVDGHSVEISGYTGNAGQVSIPESINGLPVVAIGDEAFRELQLTSVSIPNSVTSIGERAFAYNELTSVSIPNGVTTIGDGAFYDNRLTSVSIPNGVTTIGDWAFANNQLTSVSIPNGVTSIGNWAFGNNRLTSVSIPNSTVIGENAFDDNVNITRR